MASTPVMDLIDTSWNEDGYRKAGMLIFENTEALDEYLRELDWQDFVEDTAKEEAEQAAFEVWVETYDIKRTGKRVKRLLQKRRHKAYERGNDLKLSSSELRHLFKKDRAEYLRVLEESEHPFSDLEINRTRRNWRLADRWDWINQPESRRAVSEREMHRQLLELDDGTDNELESDKELKLNFKLNDAELCQVSSQDYEPHQPSDQVLGWMQMILERWKNFHPSMNIARLELFMELYQNEEIQLVFFDFDHWFEAKTELARVLMADSLVALFADEVLEQVY